MISIYEMYQNIYLLFIQYIFNIYLKMEDDNNLNQINELLEYVKKTEVITLMLDK